jgi:hypothetical protein
LHHCASPHRALLEMYRVARKAAAVFEARDSLMMRSAIALGFTGDFELEAVSGEGYESGGLNNGPIPNSNFRWTEREVVETIRAADPAGAQGRNRRKWTYFRGPFPGLSGLSSLAFVRFVAKSLSIAPADLRRLACRRVRSSESTLPVRARS